MANPLFPQITAVIGKVFMRDLPELTEDTRLFDDLGLDSTTALELLMQIEDDLGVMFDTTDLELRNFQTVGTLTAFVASHVSAV